MANARMGEPGRYTNMRRFWTDTDPAAGRPAGGARAATAGPGQPGGRLGPPTSHVPVARPAPDAVRPPAGRETPHLPAGGAYRAGPGPEPATDVILLDEAVPGGTGSDQDESTWPGMGPRHRAAGRSHGWLRLAATAIVIIAAAAILLPLVGLPRDRGGNGPAPGDDTPQGMRVGPPPLGTPSAGAGQTTTPSGTGNSDADPSAPVAATSPAPVPPPPRPTPGTTTSAAGSTPSLPLSDEAEAGQNVLAGAAEVISFPGASGGKVVSGLGVKGRRPEGVLRFTAVTVPAGGSYQLRVYYNTTDPRSADFSVNNGAVQALAFPPSGSGVITSVTITVALVAGANTIEFGNPVARGPAIDRITLE